MVQLGGRAAPYSSTPVRQSSGPDSENDHFDTARSIYASNKAIKVFLLRYTNLFLFVSVGHRFVFALSKQDNCTDGSISSSPVLKTATSLEDPSFATAQASSFFIGDCAADACSLSDNVECQSREDLAGSYRYAATGSTPPGVQLQPAGASTLNGGFVVCQHLHSES